MTPDVIAAVGLNRVLGSRHLLSYQLPAANGALAAPRVRRLAQWKAPTQSGPVWGLSYRKVTFSATIFGAWKESSWKSRLLGALRLGAGLPTRAEPSNAVVPQDGLVLNEEQLERLREHLRMVAHKAHERFENAKDRAREKLGEVTDRVHERLGNQTDRAREFVDKVRAQAEEHNANQSEKARNWFERFKEQLAKKVERAEGTDREDEVRERAANALSDAEVKLTDRLDNSDEKTLARVDRAEDKAHDRIENAHDRAENALERTENRLADQISKLRDRLHDLLRRLVRIWAERSGHGGSED